MITSNQLFSALESPYLYEQFLVFLISEDGKIRHATSFTDVINSNNCSIKVEGMERFNRDIALRCRRLRLMKPQFPLVTCHIFYSQAGQPSFPVHTDKTDVLVQCVEGTLTIEVDGIVNELTKDAFMFIPEGTPHKAINEHASLALSFGYEKHIEDLL